MKAKLTALSLFGAFASVAGLAAEWQINRLTCSGEDTKLIIERTESSTRFDVTLITDVDAPGAGRSVDNFEYVGTVDSSAVSLSNSTYPAATIIGSPYRVEAFGRPFTCLADKTEIR